MIENSQLIRKREKSLNCPLFSPLLTINYVKISFARTHSPLVSVLIKIKTSTVIFPIRPMFKNESYAMMKY